MIAPRTRVGRGNFYILENSIVVEKARILFARSYNSAAKQKQLQKTHIFVCLFELSSSYGISQMKTQRARRLHCANFFI